MAGELLDTGVLVYAFTTDRRAGAAQALLERSCLVSVQGLNEFANVARRQLGMSWRELRDALAAIRSLCGPSFLWTSGRMRRRCASPSATAVRSSMR